MQLGTHRIGATGITSFCKTDVSELLPIEEWLSTEKNNSAAMQLSLFLLIECYNNLRSAGAPFNPNFK